MRVRIRHPGERHRGVPAGKGRESSAAGAPAAVATPSHDSGRSCWPREPPKKKRDVGLGYFEAVAPGRRNTTGASGDTLNGVADLGSGSNFEKVPGLSLKCLSSVVTRVVLAG